MAKGERRQVVGMWSPGCRQKAARGSRRRVVVNESTSYVVLRPKMTGKQMRRLQKKWRREARENAMGVFRVSDA